MSLRILLTGGLGFIGRYMYRRLTDAGHEVKIIDAETYAAHLDFFPDNGEISAHADIVDYLPPLGTEVIINAAAETHVDNSIQDSGVFWRTNVLGTQHLLEWSRQQKDRPLFIQISTDEVYGPCVQGSFLPSQPLAPVSPYAASKASADLAVLSYIKTYGLPARILRMTNVYGEGQYREKLIPKTLDCLRRGRPIPIHGAGTSIRHWLWVKDAADAVLTVLEKGENGEIYHAGGNTFASVAQVVSRLVELTKPEYTGSWMELCHWGSERAGMDARYALEDYGLRLLGWNPRGAFWRDLPSLVELEASTR